ncbi:SDR family oxidoreductase [Atopococcus tabaci]|uniref:SDR family oxidoreductase n=1 Tax=Atopococcus tabaci TaxID=269774 RepID=UPI0003F4CEA2|nr:SDR family NAD(P)-dependent oxidoreductase [Atopococcus tabaci]
MSKQVVVITGAGSGLGASLAHRYSELGFHVCLIGRTESKLVETAQKLPNNSYSIHPLDVSSKEEVTKVFQKIKNEVGAINVLVNNAGTGVFDLAENLPEDAVHNMIDINLKGTIFCTQEVLADMKERNDGTIVNVISTAGLEGKVTESVYCASKFGARGFTESLHVELKDTNIHVIGAYMGGMKTEFWNGIYDESETEGLMHPDDVADIIMENVKPRRNLNVDQVVIKNH